MPSGMTQTNIFFPLLLTVVAGLSTGIGSLVSLLFREPKSWYLHFSLGLSAGVMVYVSFVELLASSVKDIGFLRANLGFFGGIAFIMLIDFLIPHKYIAERTSPKSGNSKLMSAGVLTAVGIAIHNFPEGLAVFMSSMGDMRIGVALAFAIAVHNIPEGIAVAMPIYYATGSRKKAFLYSFLSGFAEPVGAIIGVLILMPVLSPAVLAVSLAFVAGIMVFISFDELLPLAFEEKREHISVLGILAGMAIMSLSLGLL